MKKVLVVDDSRLMRMIVIRLLRETVLGDFEAVQAADGQEALALTEREDFDLVVSDWNMPEMSGIEFLAALRAREKKGNDAPTTFGFVTSEGTPAMRAAAAREGAKFLIVKPVTADAFQAVLRPLFAA